MALCSGLSWQAHRLQDDPPVLEAGVFHPRCDQRGGGATRPSQVLTARTIRRRCRPEIFDIGRTALSTPGVLSARRGRRSAQRIFQRRWRWPTRTTDVSVSAPRPQVEGIYGDCGLSRCDSRSATTEKAADWRLQDGTGTTSDDGDELGRE